MYEVLKCTVITTVHRLFFLIFFINLDTESGEFFTPPSSPTGQRSALSTSEDDLGMESPDEGPDVYIAGLVYSFVVSNYSIDSYIETYNKITVLFYKFLFTLSNIMLVNRLSKQSVN